MSRKIVFTLHIPLGKVTGLTFNLGGQLQQLYNLSWDAAGINSIDIWNSLFAPHFSASTPAHPAAGMYWSDFTHTTIYSHMFTAILNDVPDTFSIGGLNLMMTQMDGMPYFPGTYFGVNFDSMGWGISQTDLDNAVALCQSTNDVTIAALNTSVLNITSQLQACSDEKAVLTLAAANCASNLETSRIANAAFAVTIADLNNQISITSVAAAALTTSLQDQIATLTAQADTLAAARLAEIANLSAMNAAELSAQAAINAQNLATVQATYDSAMAAAIAASYTQAQLDTMTADFNAQMATASAGNQVAMDAVTASMNAQVALMHDNYDAQILALNTQLTAANTKVLAIKAEVQRVATEIHDTIGSELLGMGVTIESLMEQVQTFDSNAASSSVDAAMIPVLSKQVNDLKTALERAEAEHLLALEEAKKTSMSPMTAGALGFALGKIVK